MVRSGREEIAIHMARPPSERLQALFDLVEAEQKAAVHDPEVRERIKRRRAQAVVDRERMREHFKRMMATGLADPIPADPESKDGTA
jgi:hypothetical protein